MFFYQLFTFGLIFAACNAQEYFTCSKTDVVPNPQNQIDSIKG